VDLDGEDFCYILTLPLLFLIPPRLLTHLHTRPPISGTALLLSLTFLILFLRTCLIFSLTLLLNPSSSNLCYVLGPILPIALLSSAHCVLIEIPQSSGSQPGSIRLISIP